MDDFGNDYQDADWFSFNTGYAFSMSTFGMYDEITFIICFDYNIDYAAQII
jgi:hypothetical protein